MNNKRYQSITGTGFIEQKYFIVLFFILLNLFSYAAFAVAPSLQTIADQRVSLGTDMNGSTSYEYTPVALSGSDINWSKAYGPDEVKVNPSTGAVSWTISNALPHESFHLGVRANNIDGEAIETWIVTVGDGNVIYVGQNDTHKTWLEGLAAMRSGDTLVIRNGTWTSTNLENMIPGSSRKGQQPPSGDSTRFTTVMAEDPGQAIADGEGVNDTLIYLLGTYLPPDFNSDSKATVPRRYIAFKGLVIKDSQSVGIRIHYAEYIKLIDIGITNSGSSEGRSAANVYVLRSNKVLVEGLYSWGHSRYKMQFKDSTNGVVRRSVIRMDDYRGTEPVGGFQSYCSKNIVYQNNIAIDSNTSDFWTAFSNHQSMYGVPATGCSAYPEGNVFERNIGLNSHSGLMQTDAKDNPGPTVFKDMVGWDITLDRYNAGTTGHTQALHSVGSATVNNVTLGRVSADPGFDIAGGRGFFYSRGGDVNVSNTLILDFGWDGTNAVDMGPLAWSNSGSLALDSNRITNFAGTLIGNTAVTINNTNTTDPSLKYLPRKPSDVNEGATVMTMIGKSNTFYGDPGYDTETNIPMWPFPHEGLIRDQMRTYSYTGMTRSNGTQTLSGIRGYTQNDQTLTHYIWSYLGNTPPPFNVQAIAADRSVLLRWDAPAVDALKNMTAYKVYVLNNNVWNLLGQTADERTLSYQVNGLTNAQAYTFQVTSVSATSGESEAAYNVSATPKGVPVVLPSPPKPPPVFTVN